MAKRRKAQVALSTPVAKIRTDLQTVQNRYDGAEIGRRLGSWNPPPSGPNRAIPKLQILRNRSRDAVRNEWQAAGALRVDSKNKGPHSRAFVFGRLLRVS